MELLSFILVTINALALTFFIGLSYSTSDRPRGLVATTGDFIKRYFFAQLAVLCFAVALPALPGVFLDTLRVRDRHMRRNLTLRYDRTRRLLIGIYKRPPFCWVLDVGAACLDEILL